MRTFRAHYPSAYKSVAEARRSVGGFAQSCGFESAVISDIVLAVGEACSNAVEHGHVEHGELVVMCRFDDATFRAEICDNGGGFEESASASNVDPGDCLGRGRGIPIMRALMDAVEYRRTPTGTAVVLEKRLLSRGVDEAVGELCGRDSRGPGQSG